MDKNMLCEHNSRIAVWHSTEAIVLNSALLNRQDAWENLDLIKQLHIERLGLEDEMRDTDDADLLCLFDALYTQIEFELQDAWKFERNANYHRFWNRPKCTCPKLDNEDVYGLSCAYYNQSCPLHG